MVANSLVAFVLSVLLIIIAVRADDVVRPSSEWFVVASIGMSFLPALGILFALWLDVQRQVKTLRSEADELETRALEATEGV